MSNLERLGIKGNKPNILATQRKKGKKKYHQSWNFFRTKKTVTSDLSVDEFKKYFSKLLNEIKSLSLHEVEPINSSNKFDSNFETCPKLNSPFTYEQV